MSWMLWGLRPRHPAPDGNVERAVLLPAAEALPHLAPGGTAGLAARLRSWGRRAKGGLQELAQTLRQDREALEQGRSSPPRDRYLALIYPQLATAADYLPGRPCSSLRAAGWGRAKTYQWQLEEDAKSLMEQGELDGSCPACPAPSRSSTPGCPTGRRPIWTSLHLSACPVPPGCLLSVTAKQLHPPGASLETAVPT